MPTKRMVLLGLVVMFLSLCVPNAWAQTAKNQPSAKDQKATVITGQVLDTDGEPLPGVTVRNLQTKEGVGTNIDGKFSIKATGLTTLQFTYVGKEPKELKATPGNNLTVVLEDGKGIALEEVVKTGIYTRKKESFTGSSQTFNAKELKEVGNTNVIQSLRTLDPSFTLIENNTYGSDPNHLPDLEIRGKSSIVGLKEEFGEDPNQPLFILDGFETTLQNIMDLSMDRIESVTILKDAASTAIYGSKAANGVIVVETKTPEMGKLKLTYNGTFNISWADLTDYNLMNAAEKLEFERLSGNFSSNIPDYEEMRQTRYNKILAEVQRGVDTYWLSEPTRTGFNQRHNVYLQGGSEQLTFGLGVNYNKIEGVMKQSSREVAGGYLDIRYRMGPLTFYNKLSVDGTQYTNPTVGFSEYAAANPYYRKYSDEGTVERWLEYPDEGTSISATPYVSNPMYNASLNSYDKGNSFEARNLFNLIYRPLSVLYVRARLGLTKSVSEAEIFKSPNDTSFENLELTKKGSYFDSRTDQFSYDGDLSVTYGQLFNDAHQVNVVLGASIRQSKATMKSFSAIGFPEGNFTTPSFANQYPDGGKPGYSESTTRSADFYFNGGYSYKNRYLFDANLRSDGTSVFGANRQFTTTWAFGLGWNIYNENFIKNNTDIFNMFKVRASIGNPGNQSFGSFNALTLYQYNNWLLNNFGTGVLISAFGDPDLEWQKTIDLNVGLDLSMFRRFHLTFDWYHKNTDPLLANIGVPLSVGTSARLANIGRQINKGVSGTVRYAILFRPEQQINWTMSLSFAHNKAHYENIGNAMAKYNSNNQSKNMTRYYDGGSPTAIWAVPSAGIDPATGKEIFIKKDGTYTFDFSYDDEVVVGDTRPKLEGVYGNTFYWKGFSASIHCRYSFGGKAFNTALYEKIENISSSQLLQNQDKRALYDRWQKPGDVARFKSIADQSYTPRSARFVEKNDYFTIESIRLSYELPTKWMRTIGFQGLTVSAYMNDIARWSTIKDERGTSYPFARSLTFSVGLNL